MWQHKLVKCVIKVGKGKRIYITHFLYYLTLKALQHGSRLSTEFDRRSFSYFAPTIWNVLALNIRLSSTTDIFRHQHQQQ